MRPEKFIRYWSEKSSSTSESRLSARYLKAIEELKTIRSELFDYIKPQKTSKGLIAVFAPEAEQLMSHFEAAERNQATIIKDIESFLALTKGEPTLDGLVKEKHRLTKILDNAKHGVEAATLRAVRHGAKSELEAELSKEVQDELAKQDRIESDYGPKLKDIATKIAKAREILARY
jgi:hypothetical protein